MIYKEIDAQFKNSFWWQSPRKDVVLMLYRLQFVVRISDSARRRYGLEFGLTPDGGEKP